MGRFNSEDYAIMTISDNPMDTSGKVNKTAASLRYPLDERPSSFTRLRFMTYSRFNPWDNATERESGSIILPLPFVVPDNTAINTSSHNLGKLGNLTQDNWNALTAGYDPEKGTIENMKDKGTAMVTDALKSKNFSAVAALRGVMGMIGGADGQNNVSAFTGVVENPHTTIIFEGVGLRTINLEWRFSPRSEEESRALRDIYDMIKLRSHPEELLEGFALNYPDLCYITFGGKASDYLPKYEAAFITGLNITPDSAGGMSLFKSGAPTAYNFQLQAVELSILTRDKIQKQINGRSRSGTT